MGRVTRTHELLVTSLYETLSEAEQRELDAALEKSDALRAEARELREMVADIPSETPAYAGDLLGSVRRQLEEEPQSTFDWWPVSRIVAPLAVAAAFVGIFGGSLLPWGGSVTAPRVPMAGASTPMETAIAQAASAMNAGDWTSAAVTLDAALEEFPSDAKRAEALMLLGEVEFEHLNRYEQAYEVYATLREEHGDVYQEDANSIDRYALLAEAKDSSQNDARPFEALYELDAVLGIRGERFDDLQGILTQYPNTRMAAIALKALRDDLMAQADATGSAGHASALELAQGRCTDAVAAQQIALALGDTYRDALDDVDAARQHYNNAVGGTHEGVATLAMQRLAQLDARR